MRVQNIVLPFPRRLRVATRSTAAAQCHVDRKAFRHTDGRRLALDICAKPELRQTILVMPAIRTSSRLLAEIVCLLLASALLDAVTALTVEMCRSMRAFNEEQRRLCERHPQTIPHMAKGEQNGLEACMTSMENTRWRCHVPSPFIFGSGEKRSRLPKKLEGKSSFDSSSKHLRRTYAV